MSENEAAAYDSHLFDLFRYHHTSYVIGSQCPFNYAISLDAKRTHHLTENMRFHGSFFELGVQSNRLSQSEI